MCNRIEKSLELFSSGFNCAQSVVLAFCEDYDVDREMVMKMACGLGGGVRYGEICGAVTGAVLVIGLRYGQSREKCSSETIAFMDTFREQRGAVTCKDFLNCDTSTKEGREYVAQNKSVKDICPDLVRSAVMILEKMGY